MKKLATLIISSSMLLVCAAFGGSSGADAATPAAAPAPAAVYEECYPGCLADCLHGRGEFEDIHVPKSECREACDCTGI